MTKDDIVPIYMACDDNYAIHLSVVLASIVANSSANLHFIVMTSALSLENKEKILKTAKGHKVDFVYMQEEIAKLDNVKFKMEHISIDACLRYFIPTLPYDYDKCIYLDCDVVVLDDIAKLFSVDLGDNYIAGAFDAVKEKYKQKLNLPQYFNSGVLLLNIKKMREDNLTEVLLAKTLELKNELKYLDQDVLNLVCKGKSKLIDLKWGLTSPFFRRKIRSKYFTSAEREEAIYNPSIVHFTGPKKPWHITSGIAANPYTPAYFYYLSKTEFKDRQKKIYEESQIHKNTFYIKIRNLTFLLRPSFYKMYTLFKQNQKKYKVL